MLFILRINIVFYFEENMKKLIILSLIMLFSCNKEQSIDGKVEIKTTTEQKTAVKIEAMNEDIKKVESKKSAEVKPLVFKWDSELCENSGVYDSSIYTEEKLKNTLELIRTSDSVALNTDATVFSIEGVKELSLTKLKTEYDSERKKLSNLTIVDGDFWKKYKEDRIKMLDDEYELKKITIEAYSNPKVLLGNRFTEKCKEFALALSSETDTLLLETWKKVVDENMKHNGSPESLLKTYNTQKESADSLSYAKVEVMTFGWWNCANNELKQIYTDGKDQKEFEKIFTKIDRVCDEP